MTTADLATVTAIVVILLSAGFAAVAAFADRQPARHLAGRPGADVATPAAPWRSNVAPDTRPVTYVDMPPIPASAPVTVDPECRLCRDGVAVIGLVCICCGRPPVMQP